MSPITVNAVRYGIPAVLFIAGMVVWATGGIAAGALFISAATAVLLLNVLFRIGMEGDKARDREEEARRYFDEHGRWPDEREGASLQPQLLPQDLLHHLVGAAADRAQAGVAHRSLDLVLLHVAGAAVDLEGVVGHLVGGALASSLASVTSRIAFSPSANSLSAW